MNYQHEARPALGKDGKFSVMECFRTVQGEGIDIGRETIFLRLAVCNLRCVWCDTKDSWTKAGEKESLMVVDLIERFHSLDRAHELMDFVVTGGEPLLHDHSLFNTLLRQLSIEGWTRCTIETNGTVIPDPALIPWVKLFSVSPKLASSQNGLYPPTMLDKWLDNSLLGRVQLKFVIGSWLDALEVAELLKSVEKPQLFNLYKTPIIFQPEESANNYRELPDMMGQAFREIGFNHAKTDLDIRYIPQVHKMTGWR